MKMKEKNYNFASNAHNEIKYIINNTDFIILKHRLDNFLLKDKNAINGSYKIASIYFDDYKKTSYNQVAAGVSDRWKYRIRFYNNDSSYISLEKKHKTNSYINKTSVKITKEQLSDILENKNINISRSNNKLLNELYLKMKTELLRPCIFIEYDRVPYVHTVGNVRIALDCNIGYNKEFDNIFDKDKKLKYLTETVLEVKYTNLIPDYIRQKVQLNHLERTSFSKFKNCIERINRW